MATDMSARICDTCRMASLCPHKEKFMAFYENRDKVMVKCLDDDGQLNNAQEIEVRVEHRYMDGPGLKEAYQSLNLKEPGWWPCAAHYTGCPFKRHPFDTPIYAPYPHAAGYVEPLCTDARDAAGNRLPFVAPPATPRTNEYHVSPYPTYKGFIWDCNSCSYRDPNQKEVDYAKLGGTVYSTFHIDYIVTKVGETLQLDNIPIPENIHKGYQRVKDTPISVEIEGEDTVIVIYYGYVGDSSITPDYPTMEELKNEGKTHQMQFFYNGRSFVYPSTSSKIGTPVAMGVKIQGIIAQSNRILDDGTVVTTGDFIPLAKNGTGILVQKLDQIAEARQDTDAERKKRHIDVHTAQYQLCMDIVEGDLIQIEMIFDAKWQLDLGTMKLMNYGYDIIDIRNSRIISNNGQNGGNGNLAINSLVVTMPSGDLTIQTVLVDSKKKMDEANYPSIDYLEYWSPTEVAWGLKDVAVTIGNETVTVKQPIAPRYWDKELVPDKTPSYNANYPPSDAYITRPGFNLLGYSDDVEKRATFDHDLKIFNAEEMDYLILATNGAIEIRSNDESTLLVHKSTSGAAIARREKRPQQKVIHLMKNSSMERYVGLASFVETIKEVDFIGGCAMWKLDPDKIETTVMNSLRSIDPKIMNYELQNGDLELLPADMLENWEAEEIADPYMDEVYPATQLQWNMDYMPNLDLRIYQTLQNLKMPDNFQWSLFRIPSNTRGGVIWNTWPSDESSFEHDPHASLELYDGTTKPFSECKVTDTHTFDDELTATYLLVVQPNKVAGMTPYYQNYKMYQIRVTQNRKETWATFIYDGKDMVIPGTIPSMDKMKSYQLNDIYPTDAENLILDIFYDTDLHSWKVELKGDRASFYHLSNRCDVKYMQSLTINSAYDNDCYTRNENTTMQVAYRDTARATMTPPEGDSLKKIECMGFVIYNATTNDRVFTECNLEDGTSIRAEYHGESKSDIDIIVSNMGQDLTIGVTFHHGDDGTVDGCTRCKGYVDTSNLDWLEWMPICKDYQSN